MSKRHSMRKIREVLRLKQEQRCSQREICAATGLSKGSVTGYLRRAVEANVDWLTARDMTAYFAHREQPFRGIGITCFGAS